MKHTQLNLLVNEILDDKGWKKRLFAETRHLNSSYEIVQQEGDLNGFDFSDNCDVLPIGNYFVERLNMTPSGLEYPLIVSDIKDSVSHLVLSSAGVSALSNQLSYLRELEPSEMRRIMGIVETRFYESN